MWVRNYYFRLNFTVSFAVALREFRFIEMPMHFNLLSILLLSDVQLLLHGRIQKIPSEG